MPTDNEPRAINVLALEVHQPPSGEFGKLWGAGQKSGSGDGLPSLRLRLAAARRQSPFWLPDRRTVPEHFTSFQTPISVPACLPLGSATSGEHACSHSRAEVQTSMLPLPHTLRVGRL